jgi:hypothetical protein
VTTRRTKGVLSGVAIAALAAASVTAVVRYRLGHKPGPDARASLDELAVRLEDADGSDRTTPNGGVGRLLETLHRTQGVTVQRLHQWIVSLRAGTLTPDQATVAESDLGLLEREADQTGL